MKAALRSILLLLLTLASLAPPLLAQTAQVPGGRMALTFDPALGGLLSSQGIRVSLLKYRESALYPGFTLIGGTIDLTTGAGSYRADGGVFFLSATTLFDVREMVLESDGVSAFVTANIHTNGVWRGRHKVFLLSAPPTFKRMPITLSKDPGVTTTYTLDPDFWAMFSDAFALPLLPIAPVDDHFRVDLSTPALAR